MNPQSNHPAHQPIYFEDFPYPSTELSAFLFSEVTQEFVIALRNSNSIVRYKTERIKAFTEWLHRYSVRDIMISLSI